MTERREELVMMFTGGVDTTLAAARIMDANQCDRLHLLTFCNGICIKVENSRVHADELKEMYGADRIHHEIIYVTEIFKKIRSPLRELIREYNSTLVFDLCCRLSMESAAIMYSLDNGLSAICDGTNIDQGRLFLERPEYLRVSKEYFASFGIEYFSPVYKKMGGRLGRREELIQRGFTMGPKILETLNITSCLFTQPFCLMGFHTFFFTSFMRNAPLLKKFIAKHNLSLERAIELRLDRQKIARALIEEHLEFNRLAEGAEEIRIQEHFCTTKLCGQNAVDIALPRGTRIDVDALAAQWAKLGEIYRDGGLLRMRIDGVELQVFPTGRVKMLGSKNRDKAVALFERLVAPYDVFERPARAEETVPAQGA
jgi:hypothetical protein